jgi:hypothetical protein
MNTIARVILVAALAFGSGCAKPDWIQNTLVTVDVTGVWRGTGGNFELALEQHGQKVTGKMAWRGIQSLGTLAGAIEGSVTGDVFRFKQTGGTDPRVEGEMTVSGDEMSGNVLMGSGRSGARIVLQRIDASPPPRSQ